MGDGEVQDERMGDGEVQDERMGDGEVQDERMGDGEVQDERKGMAVSLLPSFLGLPTVIPAAPLSRHSRVSGNPGRYY